MRVSRRPFLFFLCLLHPSTEQQQQQQQQQRGRHHGAVEALTIPSAPTKAATKTTSAAVSKTAVGSPRREKTTTFATFATTTTKKTFATTTTLSFSANVVEAQTAPSSSSSGEGLEAVEQRNENGLRDDGGDGSEGDGDGEKDVVTKLLSTLRKRIRGGSGSLSIDEIHDFQTTTDRLLMELKNGKHIVVGDDDDDDDDDSIDGDGDDDDGEEEAKTPDTAETTGETQTFRRGGAEHAEQTETEATSTASSGSTAASSSSPPILPGDETDLRIAISRMDATAVTRLLRGGLRMDEDMAEHAFWEVVRAVDRAEEDDAPLPSDVPVLLHHIFDADLRHLQQRGGKITTNMTCMQPKETGVSTPAMNYIFDDSAHKDLPLAEGRRCEGGTCCDECSRNIYPTFAKTDEIDFSVFPELQSITFNDLYKVKAGTILQFTRLVERVRRTISYEYGLPLKSILPLQAYSRKYVAGTTQRGGGGGEGDFVTLHTDEATHSGYHYSCVLYLSTQGEDFEGGNFVFNDPADDDDDADSDPDDHDADDVSDHEQQGLGNAGMSLAEEIRRAGRKLTPFRPSRGAAVIFSSGWENMHEVERVTSGVRYAVPCFFTTCPVPEAAYEHMVAGRPRSDDDIADDWLHLLLAHRKETPVESVGRVKELLMKWHHMCTPLHMH